MDLAELYRDTHDLPMVIPVFPLARALILPRAQLPLNIFEPRYLAMVDAVMAGDRIIGMVQPMLGTKTGKADGLEPVGAAGRVTAYSETPDGRYLITLTGISRFRIIEEYDSGTAFRVCRVDFAPYSSDLKPHLGEDAVDRERLIELLKAFLKSRDLDADWKEVHASSTEALVNALSILSPYGPQEKQALLEAPDLRTRADILIALTERELGEDGDQGTTLQ